MKLLITGGTGFIGSSNIVFSVNYVSAQSYKIG